MRNEVNGISFLEGFEQKPSRKFLFIFEELLKQFELFLQLMSPP
jgi:hypothetical protein